MLVEIEVEIAKCTGAINTWRAKAHEMQRLIGCCPHECGWPSHDVKSMVCEGAYENRAEELANMKPEVLRDRFASALKTRINTAENTAAGFARSLLKWTRWHRTLSNLIAANK
jgi:hypothetical protein